MYTEKELKKIRNKRRGRNKKILGWVLIVIGLDSIIPAIIGIWLLVKNKKQVKLWDSYESLINKRGNTSFDYLEKNLDKNESELIQDLKLMIDNGFFIGPEGDIEAVIDTHRRYLVMTRNGEQMESFVKPEAKKEPEKQETEAKESYIDRIQDMIVKTEDEQVRSSLCAIEGSVRRIEKRIADNPSLALKEDIIKLEEFYLPQTYELIVKLHNQDGTPATLEKIKDTLSVCAEAFMGIERKLLDETDINTVGDMAVLKNAFAAEGLLEPDFKVQ